MSRVCPLGLPPIELQAVLSLKRRAVKDNMADCFLLLATCPTQQPYHVNSHFVQVTAEFPSGQL